jgi:hypothetical protein
MPRYISSIKKGNEFIEDDFLIELSISELASIVTEYKHDPNMIYQYALSEHQLNLISKLTGLQFNLMLYDYILTCYSD